MAGKGAVPKDPLKRVRQPREQPNTKIGTDGRLRGPALPRDLKDDDGKPFRWHPITVAWWNTWRRSAQAKTWTETDWAFLLDTALMHHMMWAKGRWDFGSEVRLRAAKFGATPEDRLRLKIEVEAPGPNRPSKPPEGVTDISSRRRRLAG